jgi:hypothetical protein
MSLGELTAVLFKDIPLEETAHDTYLVAQVFETIPIKISAANPVRHLLGATSTSTLLSRSEGPLSSYRRGVAAGVTAISRLFRHETAGETLFNIRMYTSHLGYSGHSKLNTGWGGLVERLVTGSAEGVAVTQRVKSITCKVTDFEAKRIEQIPIFTAPETREAIGITKSLFSTTLAPRHDTVWFEIDTLHLNLESNNVPELFTTVLVVNRNSSAKISLPGDRDSNRYVTASIKNGESFGESVVVTSPSPNDVLGVYLYYGGHLLATGPLKFWGDPETIKIPLEVGDEGFIGYLNIRRIRISHSFGLDEVVQRILNWRDHFDQSNAAELEKALKHYSQASESNIQEVSSQLKVERV